MYILDDYDSGLEKILEYGVRKENRTGVDSIALFGLQTRYRIDTYFPISTRRKVWPKSIFAELLWFISGSTNNKDLQAMGSNIWTPWVDPEFEKVNGFAEGSLGPIYGFQLRHFGGYYGNGIGGKTGTQNDYILSNNYDQSTDEIIDVYKVKSYGSGGIDQFKYMINELKTNPDSRRNLFSLWNPVQLNQMRLPPCHYSFQVFTNENKLSGMLTQRSNDFPVGVLANVQFYSALIYLLALECGYEPYEFVHNAADAHIYVNQIPAVEEYLARKKPDSPQLSIKKQIGRAHV